MINQVFLLGRIIGMEKIENDEITVEVKRNYKNMEGFFESDCFKCKLWVALSKKISINCKEGDLVAVKGRLVNNKGICNILAEQVILLNKGS